MALGQGNYEAVTVLHVLLVEGIGVDEYVNGISGGI
jgi:hypothetical protein